MHDAAPTAPTPTRAGRRRRATGIALIAAMPAACMVGGLGHESVPLLGGGLLGLAGLTLVSEHWRFGAKRGGMLVSPGAPAATTSAAGGETGTR